MKIAIIGAGKLGTALGQGWAKAGHEVLYGARRSDAQAPFAGARVAGVRAAVEASQVVVLATPYAGAEDALREAGDFGGRPLVDATNPIGPGLSLAVPPGSSGAETLARVARNAHVVKAFNTTGVENLADSRYGEARAAMFLAGDDASAREMTLGLARDLGFEAISIGALSRARLLEPLAVLWIKLAMQLGHGRSIAFGLLRRSGAPAPIARRAQTPRRILIAGTGNIGGGLGRAWLRAGHQVRFAVRDAASDEARALAALGAGLTAVRSAAADAEVIVLAVPFGAAVEVLAQLGDLRGKIIVDSTNAIAAGFQPQFSGDTSGAEELAKHAVGARVVKSFNQQGRELLEAPSFDGVAATNFVAGDDAEARRVVASLSEDLGLESLECGPLASARLLEPLTLIWIATAQALGTRDFGVKLLRR